MGVGPRIEDDGIEISSGLLDPGDQFAFMIGLPAIDGHAIGCGLILKRLMDVLKTAGSINARLAEA